MQINETQARRMIDDAHALGFEMFHLDAGWFRAVGDWHPDLAKFPHGLSPIAAYAHERGLRFGLWADWAQAGTSQQVGALNVNDAATRDWLTTQPPPGWKPEPFKGITIDLGAPAPHAWAAAETQRLVRDYHLDMLEHDGYVVAQGCDRPGHPHAPAEKSAIQRYRDEDFLWVDSSNSTDVSYHASLAYYDIQSKLKAMHPDLLLEICNDGGRMVDFGSAAHGDYFSIIDSYDPLSNRRAFYDASHLFPPAMLETYVRAWPTPTARNFLYMLRSGMMGWFTLMLDTTTWTPAQHAIAKEELRLYKEELRPLIRNADLYHVGARPDGKGWDATEYFDPSLGRGVLYAFHGTDKSQTAFRCHLSGLQPSRRYRLRFHDHTARDRIMSGAALARDGIELSLPETNSSELVFLTASPD
jgi:alpha-galactosidase